MFGLEKPWYINVGGTQTYAQPYKMDGTHFYCFLLEANIENLQNLCDKHLNQVTQGEIKYIPLIPMVMLGFAHISKGYSLAAPFSDYGWMPENDVAFWVPVAAVKKVLGITFIDHIAWYLPYVWVDSPMATAIGRETWGFYKQQASFNIPTDFTHDAKLTVDALAVSHFNPDSEFKPLRLLEVTRTDSAMVGSLDKKWQHSKEGFTDIASILFGNGSIRLPDLNLIVEVLDMIYHEEIPMVFLKQFRDVENGNRACYQAIINSFARMTKFHTGGFLSGDYKAKISNFQSHPIISDLGLTGEEVDILSAFYVYYDFRLDGGNVVWQAPNSRLEKICNKLSKPFSLLQNLNKLWRK